MKLYEVDRDDGHDPRRQCHKNSFSCRECVATKQFYDVLCKSGIVPVSGLAGIAELFGSLSFQVICHQRVLLKDFRSVPSVSSVPLRCFNVGVGSMGSRLRQNAAVIRHAAPEALRCIVHWHNLYVTSSPAGVRLDRFLLTRQSSPFTSPSKPLFKPP